RAYFEVGNPGSVSTGGSRIGSATAHTDVSAAAAVLSTPTVAVAAAVPEFNSNPLEVLQDVNRLLTEQAVPGIASLPPSSSVAEGTSLPGFPSLVLVATMRSGRLAERVLEPTPPEVPGERVFGLFFHRGENDNRNVAIPVAREAPIGQAQTPLAQTP